MVSSTWMDTLLFLFSMHSLASSLHPDILTASMVASDDPEILFRFVSYPGSCISMRDDFDSGIYLLMPNL